MEYLSGVLFLLTSMAIVTSSPTAGGATIIAPDEPGTLIKGPTSKATVKGPSGPLIVAVGDTGAVSSARINGGIVSASAESSGSVVLPVAPVAVPVAPVAVPLAPVAVPLAPVAVTIAPVAVPIAPVAVPLAPVAVPLAPVAFERLHINAGY